MSNKKLRTNNNDLSRISIQNFKAFGKMVDVPIRPITLIFGENSSGKSSILHSLLFLNQMRHQPQDKLADITYTKMGGNSVDLGGLPQLKYGHSNEHALSFLIEMSMPIDTRFLNKKSQEQFFTESKFSFTFNYSKTNELAEIIFNYNTLPILSLNNYSKFSNQSNRLEPDLSTFDLSFNLWLDNFLYCMNDQLIQSAFKTHLRRVKSFDRSFVGQSQTNKKASESKDNEASFMNNQIGDFSKFLNQNTILKIDIKLNANISYQSTHPNILQMISDENLARLLFFIKSSKLSVQSSNNKDFENYKFNSKDTIIIRSISDEDITIDVLLKTIWVNFCANFRSITERLYESLYLGPIRTIPTRNFDTLDSIARDPSTGSVAWDILTNNTLARNQVNNWLEKFGTNKQLTTEQLMDTAQLRRLLSEYSERTQLESAINKLTTRNMLRFYDPQKEIYLSHRDMGVGISQVLPVIVNCVANNNTTVLIEQPELHLHPRLQGDLADLFIETAIKGEQKNTYLIETHSEHIIRRVMRRIREDQHKPVNKTRITKEDVAILYVAAGPNGNTVTQLRLDDEGDLIDEWPNGFFEEGFRDDMAGR